MDKFKILDCDSGCGGFTKGFEESGFFEVISNPLLSEKNLLCYNSSHINNFEIDDDLVEDYDLLHYSFSEDDDFNSMLLFLSLHNDIDNLFISTNRKVFSSVQNSNEVFYINEDFPVRDRIVCFLNKFGYKDIFCYIYNKASFGLPQNIFRVIYFASKEGVSLSRLDDIHGRFQKPYASVQDFLYDINDYSSLSWHDVDYSKKDVCSMVLPGSNARLTKGISQKNGYNRLEMSFIDTHLYSDFYTVSSRYPSIHPLYDRPLTIREGARLFGLSDDFDWDGTVVKKKAVAKMIYESFYPKLSEMIGKQFYGLIKRV